MLGAAREDHNIVGYYFSCAVVPDHFRVLAFEGTEALNQPYRLTIHLSAEDEATDMAELLGRDVTLNIERGEHGRSFHGIVGRLALSDNHERPQTSIVEIVPALSALKMSKTSRIFQHKTALDIVEEVLTAELRPYRREFDSSGLTWFAGIHVPPSHRDGRTRTVPHGPGYNEISFEDAMGTERVHVRAQRDLDELVLHNHITDVRASQTNSVACDQHETIGRDQRLHVRGQRQVTVLDIHSEASLSDHHHDIDGGETITVGRATACMGNVICTMLVVFSLSGCGPRGHQVAQGGDPRQAPELEMNALTEAVDGEHVEEPGQSDATQPGQPAAPEPGEPAGAGAEQPTATEPVEPEVALEGAADPACPPPAPAQATNEVTLAGQVVDEQEVPVRGARIVVLSFARGANPWNRCFAVVAQGTTGRNGRFEVTVQRFGSPYDTDWHLIEVERGGNFGFHFGSQGVRTASVLESRHDLRIRAEWTGLLDVEVRCAEEAMTRGDAGAAPPSGPHLTIQGRVGRPVWLARRPSAPNLFGAQVRLRPGRHRLAISSRLCGVHTELIRVRRGQPISPVSVTLPRPETGTVELSFPVNSIREVRAEVNGLFFQTFGPDEADSLRLERLTPGVYRFLHPHGRNLPSCVYEVEVFPNRTTQLALRFEGCRTLGRPPCGARYPVVCKSGE